MATVWLPKICNKVIVTCRATALTGGPSGWGNSIRVAITIEQAPSESGRGFKSECTSGQVRGLSSPGISRVGGVEIALGITGGTGGARGVGRVSSAEESASSMKVDGLRCVRSDGQEEAVHSRTGVFGSLLQTDRVCGCVHLGQMWVQDCLEALAGVVNVQVPVLLFLRLGSFSGFWHR